MPLPSALMLMMTVTVIAVHALQKTLLTPALLTMEPGRPGMTMVMRVTMVFMVRVLDPMLMVMVLVMVVVW